MKLSFSDLQYYFCSTMNWTEKQCYPYIKRMQSRQFNADVPAELQELAFNYANNSGEIARQNFDRAAAFCENNFKK